MDKPKHNFDRSKVVNRVIPANVTFERNENEDQLSIGNISGTGIVFNKFSQNLGGFIEVVEERAINDNTDFSRCICAPDHDWRKLIGGVQNETLTYEKTSEGVRYNCQVGNTTDGKDTVNRIERGDIKGSSFRFRIAENGSEFEELPDELREQYGVYWLHRITDIAEVLDFAPTSRPAYLDTTAEKERSIEPPQIPEKPKTKPENKKTQFNKYKYL